MDVSWKVRKSLSVGGPFQKLVLSRLHRGHLRYICDVPECNHRIHTYPDELHQGLKKKSSENINKLNEAGVISPRVNIE